MSTPDDARKDLDNHLKDYWAAELNITLTALRGMALEAREADEAAAFIELDDSDQGAWAFWTATLDANGDVIDDDPDDNNGWAANLADNTRLDVNHLVADGTEYDGRNPWQGVRIDIEKVLADARKVDHGEIRELYTAALAAAGGDSNDGEISAWRSLAEALIGKIAPELLERNQA